MTAGVLESVVDEVGDDLRQAIGVGSDTCGRRGDVEQHPDISGFGTEALAARFDQLIEVDVSGGQGELPGIEASQIEQVPDEPIEAPGLREDDRPGSGGVARGAIGERLGIALDAGERRAQVV